MNVNLRNRDRAFIQGGELLIRPKNSGAGYHYGTGITGGYVAHITPEEGKHVDAGEEFCTPWCIRVRFERSDVENYIVEERALADLGVAIRRAHVDEERLVLLEQPIALDLDRDGLARRLAGLESQCP